MSRPEGLVCDSARSFEPLADAEKRHQYQCSTSILVLPIDCYGALPTNQCISLSSSFPFFLSLPNSYIVLYYIIPYLVYRMLILHLARCWAWPSLPDPRSCWRGSNLISWELVQNSDGQPFGIIYIILSYLFFLGASSKKIFVNFSLR